MPKLTAPAFVHEPDPQHPILGGGPRPHAVQRLGDPGGLIPFGAMLEDRPSGSRSGHRQWDKSEGEMVHVLPCEGILVEDGETTLRAGDAACWPANNPIGHRLDNRSNAHARYLVIGARNRRDVIPCSDHDLITHEDGPARRYTRADGTPHPERRTT